MICPGGSWQFMQSEHRPAPACIRCERQSNGGYAPPALIALALPQSVLNSFFSPGVGRPPEVAFALCSSPLPAQSDGFSDTIKSVADPADRQGGISARTGAGMWTALAPFALKLFLLTSCECLSDMPSVYLVSSMGGNLSGSSTYGSSPPAGKSTHSLSAV